MTGTPPEANIEYSRGSASSRGLFARRIGAKRSARSGAEPSAEPTGASGNRVLADVILAIGVLGALLLIVAEFTSLYTVHSAASQSTIRTVSTGSHNDYSLLPIALLAVVLSLAGWRWRSRAALLAVGALAVIALLIALLADLPDAHASGLVGSAATLYTSASTTPSAGFYLETTGAMLLLIASVCGQITLGGSPPE
jgi:hypothetical protein